MSMISEQVKELREIAKNWNPNTPINPVSVVLNKAADTIESLSAKLETANKELERWHTDKINDKIKNPFAWTSTLCCHNCDHKDEYIEELEAADMERSAEDCGGWIYCGDGNNLPGPGRRYRVTALWKDGDFETRSVYDLVYGTDGIWHGENYIPVSFEIIAWKPLEEPYKENIEEHVRKSILGVAQMSDKAWANYRKEQRAIKRAKGK